MSAIVPAEAAPEVQKVYQVQLAHLDACERCRVDEPCEDGRRIRRALQAARTAAMTAPSLNSRRVNGGL